MAKMLAAGATELGEWAESEGLARETVSRGFAAAYGVAPARANHFLTHRINPKHLLRRGRLVITGPKLV